MCVFVKDTPVLALKIIKSGVVMYFAAPCHGYALNCHAVYFAVSGICLLFTRKQSVFAYMQQQRVKFKFGHD